MQSIKVKMMRIKMKESLNKFMFGDTKDIHEEN